LLALGVLSIAVINLVGVIQLISSWQLLKPLLPFSPTWLGISRLFWAVTGLVIVWGLWVGRHWAPRLTKLATVIFVIYFWSDRLLLFNPDSLSANIPFMIVITLLSLGFVFLVLASSASERYFGATDD
jgi:hypothetical protein